MKPWSRVNHLRKFGAFCGKQAVARAARDYICLTSVFLPRGAQRSVISTGPEPAPRSSLLCPASNISLRLCFARGLAKCRGEKKPEKVFGAGLGAVIAQSATEPGGLVSRPGAQREQASSSFWGSGTIKVQACVFLSPRQTPNQQVVLMPHGAAREPGTRA